MGAAIVKIFSKYEYLLNSIDQFIVWKTRVHNYACCLVGFLLRTWDSFWYDVSTNVNFILALISNITLLAICKLSISFTDIKFIEETIRKNGKIGKKLSHTETKYSEKKQTFFATIVVIFDLFFTADNFFFWTSVHFLLLQSRLKMF